MSADPRRDPDALLARAKREEAKQGRGRLKIFFGAAAGVGKTYAMLLAAREKRAESLDVVVGIVETHGRAETAALLDGLEILPPRLIEYRGAQIQEFDLDAALKRHPAIILVDELAHTNAEGSRHPKRWNDVEELLDAGIDVYTALNVQHLESLNDVVGGITGIRVQETVPDTVFDQADEVELIDLPPDELIERLHEGKVYMPQQARAAVDNFFRKGNLMALRELSLRRTAERVEEQMRDYRTDQGIRDVWQAGDRIMVCIGPGQLAERLIRAGRRLAAALHAEWIVAYIETPRLQRLPAVERDAIMQDLRLAESLGADTATLSAQEMSAAILDYAHEKNVTKILLGKPTRTGWKRWLLGSVVDTVVRQADDIDVFLIGSDDVPSRALASERYLQRTRAYFGLAATDQDAKARWPGYAVAVAVPALCTTIGFLSSDFLELLNLVMVYLLGVMLVASRYGHGPSILSSALAVAAVDFFFVPPQFTFAVSDVRYLTTFAVMLLVGIVISNLASNLRTQAKVAGYREKRAATLYELSRQLANCHSIDEAARAAVKQIGIEFDSQSVLLLPDDHGRIVYPRGESQLYSLHHADLAVAQWVHDNGHVAGRGTNTLPGAEAIYMPLSGSGGIIGVLAILPVSLRRVYLPEQQRLLDTFLNQTALAIERVRLAEQARNAQVQVETESLRNSLLSAISHDLRTPLSSIVGASSSLVEDTAGRLDAGARRELTQAIYDEAQRMAMLANNILDMARLDTGAIALKRDWYPLEEVIGSVLTRLRTRLEGRPVEVRLEPGLPLVKLDAAMIEQVLVNLFENALKYTPKGTPLEIGAEAATATVTLWIADRGPGISVGQEERLFEKFYRATPERAQSGVGLGLTICRAVVEAHGGIIWAANRPGGGAVFRFTLPLEETPPEIVPEAEQLVSRP